jgi:hypothetical protein
MKRAVNILIIVSFIFLSGCGWIEKSCDDSNYESMSNERGTIELISCGVIMSRYENAKVIYSNADSNALLFEDAEGNEIYWQGEVRFYLK